jgi:hypothetical protein
MTDSAALEIFPFGFEILGAWEDPATLQRKTLVRFFSTDRQGQRAGRDAYCRVFGSIDFLIFLCSRERRSAVAIEPQEELTAQDRARVAAYDWVRSEEGESNYEVQPHRC